MFCHVFPKAWYDNKVVIGNTPRRYICLETFHDAAIKGGPFVHPFTGFQAAISIMHFFD